MFGIPCYRDQQVSQADCESGGKNRARRSSEQIVTGYCGSDSQFVKVSRKSGSVKKIKKEKERRKQERN